jgi:uncharacterized repeat protein (TIGR03803 family)
MRYPTFSATLTSLLAVFLLAAAGNAQAGETVIHTFSAATGGGRPFAGLIADKSGNLYGTTTEDSTVFELSPPTTQGGSWTYTVLYTFQGGIDGAGPEASLVFDAAGNLYGTTVGGGQYQGGTVFELTPENGVWKESILYSFQGHAGHGNGPSDGYYPKAGLVFDAAGNLYGTTTSGGMDQCEANEGASYTYCGTVFQLKPPSIPGGAWTETLIFHFTGGTDGQTPYGALIIDNDGVLYGTSYGDYFYCASFVIDCGTVFSLAPPAQEGGAWQFRLLHSFGVNDGQWPMAALVQDQKGNLYGTTQAGGSAAWGTVFELTRPATSGGSWAESLLYNFPTADNGSTEPNGASPECNLVFDKAGNLYGSTLLGGSSENGAAFKLTPPSAPGGTWTQTVINSFGTSVDAGANPVGGLIFGKDGLLYGNTQMGGSHNYGTVFGLTP